MTTVNAGNATTNDLIAKLERLLAAYDDALTSQAVEMIMSLEDPEVDEWVLSGVGVRQARLGDVWEIPGPLADFHHPRISWLRVLDVLRRAPLDSPVATTLREQLSRLYVERCGSQVADLSWLDALPTITELLVSAVSAGTWYRKRTDLVGNRLTGMDALARLPALRWLVVIGVADLDLAPLVALPGLERLSVYGGTLATDAYDLRGGTLGRLDLANVAGLARLTPPPTLRELHLAALPDLTAIGDLSTATGLTDLSIVDCPRFTDLPPLPPPAGAGPRRVRLTCPALTSIAPLAGRTLESLDLTGCAALTSLDGFPETLEATQLSLYGCTGIGDVSAVAAAAGALRSLDLRGLAGVTDVSALDRLPDLAALALAGTATDPGTVPATLLPSCTWAHTPDLDLLGQRPRLRP